jgi:hypothetical protein
MINTLSFADRQTRPLIVMDAGIATQSNLLGLKEKGSDFLIPYGKTAPFKENKLAHFSGLL